MEPKDWVALAGILSTFVVSLTTLINSRRREREQQIRDDRIRREQQEREDRLLKEQKELASEEEWKRRTYSPHIEFDIACHFYGPEGDYLLAEILLYARNKGVIRQEFKGIHLRIRGIAKNDELRYREGDKPRLAFPVEIHDIESILPKDYNFFFIEPGVDQTFTYVTKIPASIKYIVVFAKFDYDKDSFHTSERLFKVCSNLISREDMSVKLMS